MFKGKKVIIFDMDGTLIDSVGIWNEVDKNFIKKLGATEELDETSLQKQRDILLRTFSKAENPYLEYCKTLGKKYHSELSAEQILKLRYDVAQDYLKNKVDYKPYADEFIRKLKEENFVLAIASTTRRDNMRIYQKQNENIMKKAAIDDYFSLVLTREDVKEMKPNPEVFLKVVEELKLKKEECLIFEDTLVGVEAAKNAGMEVVAMYDKYSDGEREEINQIANYQLDNYADAIEMLDERE